jgi:hypothetical protein
LSYTEIHIIKDHKNIRNFGWNISTSKSLVWKNYFYIKKLSFSVSKLYVLRKHSSPFFSSNLNSRILQKRVMLCYVYTVNCILFTEHRSRFVLHIWRQCTVLAKFAEICEEIFVIK